MKKKPQTDIVDLFQRFQKEVLDRKPSFTQMFDEVRMMKFKVRPVTGDIGALDFQNNTFVETLWSLGKLDEFFHNSIKDLSKDEKQVFFRLFDDIYQDYQSQLNDINIRADKFNQDNDFTFEVEIFREKFGSGN
jgi:hypothetical protein